MSLTGDEEGGDSRRDEEDATLPGLLGLSELFCSKVESIKGFEYGKPA